MTPDLEEIQSLHRSIIQTHVLVEVKSGYLEGTKIGLIWEKLQIFDDGL